MGKQILNFIGHYPEHHNNKTTNEVLKAEEIELNKEYEAIEVLKREFFLETAIESLPMWAKFAGIEDNEDLEIDIRRSNILAALKTRDITNVDVIKNIAESYTNGTCRVIENYADYSFTIEFISTVGVPRKIEEIKKSIDTVKPAHLAYSFKFRYITWGDTKNLGKPASWYKDKGLTWEDVKEGRHLDG